METAYYKKLRDDGSVVCLLTYQGYRPGITNPLVVEITAEEYNALHAEILAAIPAETDPDEIDDTEALTIIMGVNE